MTKGKIHKHVALTCLIAIAFLLPFSITGTSIATIALLLNWLIEGELNAKMRLLYSRKLFLVFLALFVVYTFSLSYSSNVAEGLKILEKKLSLFILPLVIGSMTLSVTDRKKLFLFFLIGVVLKSAFSLVQFAAAQPGIHSFIELIREEGLRDNYYAFTSIHPTYLSYFTVLSIFFISYLYFTSKYRSNVFIVAAVILVLLYLLVLLVLLSSRMPQVAFVAASVVTTAVCLIKHKKYKILAGIFLGFILVLVFVVNTPSLLFRFKEVVETPLAPPQGIHHNSTNIRVGILICATDLLKDNWLVGLGTGDVQFALNECYKSRNFSDVLYLDGYNTHNTYFDIWLTSGIFGLIALVLALLLPLIKSLKQESYLYVAFTIFFIVCCITESLLNTNKGVVAFTLFNSLIALSLYPVHKNKPIQQYPETLPN